jgi:hypothetical protein
MPPRAGTSLKRGASIGDDEVEFTKKPRRSARVRPQGESHTPLKSAALPSPLTHLESTTTERLKDGTVTPPSPVSLAQKHNLPLSPSDLGNSQLFAGFGDTQRTQPFSQVIYPPPGLSYEVEDEEAEGVWGYLVPLDGKTSQYETLVLKDRRSCPQTLGEKGQTTVVPVQQYSKQEEEFEKSKIKKLPSQGYLIGRHPECGTFSCLYCIADDSSPQISSSMFQQSQIGIASYLPKQKAAAALLCWKTLPVMAPLSTMPWSAETIAESCMTAMRLASSTKLDFASVILAIANRVLSSLNTGS